MSSQPSADRAGEAPPECFAVVMAGGSGTRFWPASRTARPKQFLQLAGSAESLLQASVRRAAALVGLPRVLVVTGEPHAALAREQLPGLPEHNLLLEPLGRNTAPCLAWAAARIHKRAPGAVIAALPADPHIGDERLFQAALERALQAAAGGAIATLGIKPSRAETGYGYLEVGEPVSEGVHRVDAFIEKPDRERAQRFAQSGRHLWNSGMFFFRADVILREIARHLPELGAFVARCERAQDAGAEQAVVAESYPALQGVSIDYGVMERADGIVVVPAAFGWDDLGSWGAAWALAAKDPEGNAARAELLAIDAGGCLVSAAQDKLVVLLGVEDLVVVDTPDALLVVPRDRAQDVGQVVKTLRAGGRTRHL